MRLKIWNEESKNETNDEQLFVKLIDEEAGIVLAIVNKNGEVLVDGHLLGIVHHLKAVVLVPGLNEKIPLKTDMKNTILCVHPSEFKDIPSISMRISPSDILQMIKEGIQDDFPKRSTH